jgi:hypothetical protein
MSRNRPGEREGKRVSPLRTRRKGASGGSRGRAWRTAPPVPRGAGSTERVTDRPEKRGGREVAR